jgi:acetyl esterase/lipase
MMSWHCSTCVVLVTALCLPLGTDSTFAGSPDPQEISLKVGIIYGLGGGEPLKLDLASPDPAAGELPAIVFIHGGGWRYGDRTAYRSAIVEAALRGYVAVSVDYRLTDPDKSGKPKYPFPACVEDVKCAVRWLRGNAKKLHVDPNRIGVTGDSAGGHLSLMVGLTDASAGLEGKGGNPDMSSRVQAVVNIFGPTDMASLHPASKKAADRLDELLGGPPSHDPELYRVASPVTYVSKDDPPTLTIHGTKDVVVVPEQAAELDAAMKKVGVPHTLLMIEGQGHGFQGKAATAAREETFKFFDEQLKKKS